jgi:hypothetical protein
MRKDRHINTVEDLKDFLRDNWETMNTKLYVEIMRETLGVYEREKPPDITKLFKAIDKQLEYPEAHEKPLFLEL